MWSAFPRRLRFSGLTLAWVRTAEHSYPQPKAAAAVLPSLGCQALLPLRPYPVGSPASLPNPHVLGPHTSTEARGRGARQKLEKG